MRKIKMRMRRALIVLTALLLAAPPAAAEDTVGLVDPDAGLWYLRDEVRGGHQLLLWESW